MGTGKLLIRIMVGALLLLIAYNAFLLIAKPRPYRGQHQWQDNVITAQRYVYAPSGPPVVIVGTSFSQRLQGLPPDYFNLALGGLDATTGLTILLRERHDPSLVLIETNELREVDRALLASVYGRLSYPLKRYVLCLRDEFHPFTVLMWFLKGMPVRTPIAHAKPPQLNRPPQFLQAIVDRAKIPVDSEYQCTIATRVDLLARIVDRLVERGSIPVFYRMPHHRDVSNATRIQYRRYEVAKRFPSTRYHWLPDVRAGRFQTTDGFHLSRHEADEYSRLFVSHVEALRKKIAENLRPDREAPP